MGFALVFDVGTNTWQYIADHRGETRWNIQSRQVQEIYELGGVPRDTTEKAPTSDFDLWDGAEWIKDTQAEKYFHIEAAVREHKERINLATDRINTLQDAIDLEMATDFEVERLRG